MKKKKRSARRTQKTTSTEHYQQLETRQVLAALFPTYIDGNFTLGNGPGAPTPYALADTFDLSSNPSATKTIYLDFDGHHSVNNRWGHNIVFPAFSRDANTSSFSNAELIEIQLQFQNVAEDFLPFDVNVTTREPAIGDLINDGNGDQRYGVRAVNTQATDGFGNGIGGVAYLFSFDDDADNPVFTFNKGANNGGMTNSHEVGHALGLRHDGLGSSTYHPGVGSGETSWGPIMGAPFGENVTQWSNGDYANSTNTEDDYSIITGFNGFGFRADTVGDTTGTANSLTIDGNGDVFDWNIIEQNDDVDVYSFQANGVVSLNIDAMAERPNLDISATILDSNGDVVATDNPVNGVDASFNLSLPSGQYFLSIDGVGKPGVYSDYGSIGLYTIDGNVEQSVATSPIGEVGQLSINSTWTTIRLDNTYVDPVVVAGPASRLGSDPVNIRIRNVTSTSFQIHVDEWEYLNGVHLREMVSYMVVEAGEHTLSDGTVMVANNVQNQRHTWKTADLGTTFSSRPVVFSQIVTENDPISATTRMRFTSDSVVQFKIKEEQAQVQSHGAETLSYIAIEAGEGTTGASIFEAGVTPDDVRQSNYSLDFNTTFADTPAFFADMQSHDGSDTATVRYRSIDNDGSVIYIEEEQSFDSEVAHTRETVGYLAIETGTIEAQTNIPFNPAANTPIDWSTSELWKDVKEQASWPETTLPFDHDHDDHDDHDHDDHDHDDHDHDFNESDFERLNKLWLQTTTQDVITDIMGDVHWSKANLKEVSEKLNNHATTHDPFFATGNDPFDWSTVRLLDLAMKWQQDNSRPPYNPGRSTGDPLNTMDGLVSDSKFDSDFLLEEVEFGI